MNPDLQKLQPYPFEKLAALKAQVSPNENVPHIALSIGEPKHPAPEFVTQCLKDNIAKVENYPTTKGLPQLREAIAQWLKQRFGLTNISSEQQILPVNGTREALFAFTQTIIDRSKPGLVISPNPFYQIYEGAAYLAGAEPYFIPCLEAHNFNPDFDSVSDDVWQQCQLLFLCSPGNPTGAVLDLETLTKLIALADKHNFVIASDECYSEIFVEGKSAPIGLLQACESIGRYDYARCVVFHSLSKRSNLPGLRSGFVAGDAEILQAFLLYRTYHGCAMSVHTQLASIAAWSDEKHVQENRRQYTLKFNAALDILSDPSLAGKIEVAQSDASFYLWMKTELDEELFAQQLFAQQNVTVLPGSYLSRTINGINPGKNRVRLALVASVDECIEAAKRIKQFVQSL